MPRHAPYHDSLFAGHVDIVMTYGMYAKHYCRHNGAKVVLQGRRERDMLACLLMRRGRVTTKYDLLDFMYDHPDNEPEMKIIEVYICRLRRKLPGVIFTRWGGGFIIPKSTVSSEPERVAEALAA